MAKSNPIILSEDTPDSTLGKAIVQGEANSLTLGNVVQDAFAKSEDAITATVDLGEKTVTVLPDGPAPVEGDNEVGIMKVLGEITRDDPSKPSSPMTFTPVAGLTGSDADLSAAISAKFAAAKPSKNVGTGINAVEDANASLDEPITDLKVSVDQQGDNGHMVVHRGTGLAEGEPIAVIEQDADPLVAEPVVRPWE